MFGGKYSRHSEANDHEDDNDDSDDDDEYENEQVILSLHCNQKLRDANVGSPSYDNSNDANKNNAI